MQSPILSEAESDTAVLSLLWKPDGTSFPTEVADVRTLPIVRPASPDPD